MDISSRRHLIIPSFISHCGDMRPFRGTISPALTQSASGRIFIILYWKKNFLLCSAAASLILLKHLKLNDLGGVMLLTWWKSDELPPYLCHLKHFWHNLVLSTLSCPLLCSCSTLPNQTVSPDSDTLLADLVQPPGQQGPNCQLRQDSSSVGRSVWSLPASPGGAHRRDLFLCLQLRGRHHHYRYTLSSHTHTHTHAAALYDSPTSSCDIYSEATSSEYTSHQPSSSFLYFLKKIFYILLYFSLYSQFELNPDVFFCEVKLLCTFDIWLTKWFWFRYLIVSFCATTCLCLCCPAGSKDNTCRIWYWSVPSPTGGSDGHIH